jgi:threonine/homoserine/homoserine lactone efflux protein
LIIFVGMEYVFQAIGIGFLLSIMIGPVFFVLLEISITKGFKSAMIFDAGVLLSDLFYIVISLFFAYQLKGLGDVKNNLILSVLGGALFIAYGVYNLLFKQVTMSTGALDEELLDSEEKANKSSKNKNNSMLVLKGFMLNLLNPGVVIYWLAIIAKGFDLVAPYESDAHIVIFITIILITFFGIDCLKAYVANKIKPLVTVKLLRGLNGLIGFVFLGTGVFLILRQLL